MRRRLAIVYALIALSVLASAPVAQAATAKFDQAMLAKINEERGEHGLKPLAEARRLTRSCRSYARRMLSDNRWAHTGSKRVKGVGRFAEILGRTPGRASVDPVVRAWLASPVHRKVLLGARYRRVGVAHRTGRMGGRRTTVWVLRFAR